MKVTKQSVEQFQIGDALTLSRAQALALHKDLGAVLGVPQVEYMRCDNRFSHGAHSEVTNGITYLCSGLSFDRT